MDDDTKAKALQQLAPLVSKTWAILNTHLENRTYVFGDAPSIIDYLLAVYVSWNTMLPAEINITIGPNVDRLVNTISAFPEFKAAYAAENAEYKRAA